MHMVVDADDLTTAHRITERVEERLDETFGPVRVHPVVLVVGTSGHEVAQLVAKLQRRQRRPNAQEEHGGAQG